MSSRVRFAAKFSLVLLLGIPSGYAIGQALVQVQEKESRARMVPMRIPEELRGGREADVTTRTFDVEAQGVRGQMRLTVTREGKIVDLELSRNLIDRGVPADLIAQPRIFKRVTQCLRDNKCADKPTSAGVITCVATCLLDPVKAAVTR